VTPKSTSPGITGTASWYPAHGLIAAAGPALRTGDWRGRVVVVSANGRAVAVTLSDTCQCYGSRLLDLSDDAFSRLAPLSRGLIQVVVSSAGPLPTPPATDR
jgi:rare lipoprotein A (peptidoglycan hydrolase)